MPDMFDDEEEYFKKISKINEQIREERKKESEKVSKMTDEELFEYEKNKIEEVNKFAKENGQKIVYADIDSDDNK